MSSPLQSYLDTLLGRERVRREEREHRAEDVRARLPEVAATLRSLGARRVFLFGSLLGSELYRDSDVDLAVEGLPVDNYFEAIDRAARVLRVPVDIVRTEEAPPSLLVRIEREGEPLG